MINKNIIPMTIVTMIISLGATFPALADTQSVIKMEVPSPYEILKDFPMPEPSEAKRLGKGYYAIYNSNRIYMSKEPKYITPKDLGLMVRYEKTDKIYSADEIEIKCKACKKGLKVIITKLGNKKKHFKFTIKSGKRGKK